MEVLWLVKTETGKVHIAKSNGKSICGQVPSTSPVFYFNGVKDEVTCDSCYYIKYSKFRQAN